jgi:thioredoxin-like negative regulator of GroEL
MPVAIDDHGVLFRQFNVRSIPLLLKLKDGKVVAETNEFSDSKS